MENGNKKIVFIIIIIIEILIILGIGIWLIFNSGTPIGNNSSKKYVAYRWTDVSTDGYTKTNSYHGSDWYTELNPNSKIYLRTDGTTQELCGVFSSGTVCLTPNYHGYYNDFTTEKHTHDIKTAEELKIAGLRGYSLAKSEEMLSKGASFCSIIYSRVYCHIASGGNCGIAADGSVHCYDDGSNFWLEPAAD